MPDYLLTPARPHGELHAPPSKSAAHRALICAALSGEPCRVSPVSRSADMDATMGVLAAMGSRFTREQAAVVFSGAGWAAAPALLNCIESGSTLRFLLPVAAALGIPATFTGEGRLPDRPIGVLAEQMKRHGVSFSSDRMPFTLSGRLTGGQYLLPGNVSSQFISGLLFALPLLPEGGEILLDSPLQSAGYVEMTLESLRGSGIRVEELQNGWRVPGGQAYSSGDRTVEADWSNAAFWLCAGAIGGKVRLTGLSLHSVQGDRAILEIIRRFGGQISQDADGVCTCAAPLHGCRVDAGPIPDLIPVVAVMAAFAHGETEIYNAARLRIKESDRLATVSALLRSLGGTVAEYSDRLVIQGGGLHSGTVDGANDHRIVMAAAVAGMFSDGPVTVTGVEAVGKSYPDFFADYQKLGGFYAPTGG